MPRWLKLRLKDKSAASPRDDRPTEDDIAKAKLGPQGILGKPDKSPIADEDKLQLSKVLDPGHTA